MTTRTTTIATTTAKQKETKKPSAKSTAKKKAVDLGDCLVLPSFANNEYKTQYSQFVRSERDTSLVKTSIKVNYAISLVLVVIAIVMTVVANNYIRGI
mgnify:CR=1 FL=1